MLALGFALTTSEMVEALGVPFWGSWLLVTLIVLAVWDSVFCRPPDGSCGGGIVADNEGYAQALSDPPSADEGYHDGPEVPHLPAQVGQAVIGSPGRFVGLIGRDHAEATALHPQKVRYNLHGHPHLVPPD